MLINKVTLFNLPFGKIHTNELTNLLSSNKKYNIYFCTLNEIVMAEHDPGFRKMLLKPKTILVTDGVPLVWLMKYKTGFGERIYGPDFLRKILFNKNYKNNSIFVGDSKNKKYFEKFGNYIIMPMKEKFTKNDYKNLLEKINKNSGKIVWLGLGSKKQIEVADQLKIREVEKIIITIGAAFDFLSGNKKQAPKIIQISGLEWLFRLMKEPKRLWPRYSQILKFLVNRVRVYSLNFFKHF